MVIVFHNAPKELICTNSAVVAEASVCRCSVNNTAWKVHIFGIFLVPIFSHSDWIRIVTLYLSVFSPNARKCGPEKLRTRTFFTQYKLLWKISQNSQENSFDAVVFKYICNPIASKKAPIANVAHWILSEHLL